MKSLKRKDLLFPELSYQIIGSAFDVSNGSKGVLFKRIINLRWFFSLVLL